MERVSKLLFLFALIGLLGFACQQNLQPEEQNSVAKFITSYAQIVKSTDNSITLQFPDTLWVVATTDDGKQITTHTIQITCQCPEQENLTISYARETGQIICQSGGSQCKLTLTSDKNALKNFMLKYEPKDKMVYLAGLIFTKLPFGPAEPADLTHASCNHSIELSDEQWEILAKTFKKPQSWDKPFYLYPVKFDDGSIAYIATTEITMPGYYIPVKSLDRAKCKGCNGTCKLGRRAVVIYCESTCQTCTLEIED